MNREQFDTGIRSLVDAFGKQSAEGRLREYALALKHLPAESWEVAVRRAIAEGKFFPSVSELLEYARAHLELTGYVIPTSTAWELAIKSCSKWAPRLREEVDYPNAAIRETVKRMGGPEIFAMTDRKQLEQYRRKDFERIYDGLCLSAEAIGVNARAVRSERRYVLLPGAYRIEGREQVQISPTRVIDRQTGKVVAPEWLLTEGQDGRDDFVRIGGGIVDRPLLAAGGGASGAGGDSGAGPGLIPATVGGGDHGG